MSAEPAAGPLPRLAVVLSHPTQYYSPWFRWVRAHTGLPFRVFYLWDSGVVPTADPQFRRDVAWDVDLLSGYDHEFVPNVARHPGADRFTGFQNPGLTRRLAAWKPDAVLLFGYKWTSHLKVVAWASLHGIPLLLRGDSHLLGRGSPPLRSRLALRLLFARFRAFLYVGTANRAYFEAFGVPARRLFLSPHSVDASHFDRDSPAPAEAAAALRSRLGLGPDTRVVLFAGKFVPAKQPAELMAAFASLDAPGTALVMAGDGPEREALVDLAARLQGGLRNSSLHFLPFANQSEMPARYRLADLFVLPSKGVYETWGLAVNEAMHMGVPCLVSDRVGCQADLVTDGETGWVFRVGEPDGLAQALGRALGDLGTPGRRAEIRAAVGRRIAGYTYAQTTQGLLGALKSLGGRPHPVT
jgi:glycosyltransferase involved in cell wall biosynthesis